MAETDRPAQLTVAAARILADTARQWAAFRRSGHPTTLGAAGDVDPHELHAVCTAADSDGDNHWAYTGDLYAGPGTGDPIAEDVLIYNSIEDGNTGASASGYTIGMDGVTGVRPAPLGKPFRVKGPFVSEDDDEEWSFRIEWPNIPDVECEE